MNLDQDPRKCGKWAAEFVDAFIDNMSFWTFLLLLALIIAIA